MSKAAEQATMDPFGLCGSTVADKYRIGSLVGAGGFGVVYRGTHTAFGEPIAVKCLHVSDQLQAKEREELLRKLQEEGAVLHRLSKRCAAIVQALDVGAMTTPAGQWVPYLVLEWLDGETLAEHLASRRAARSHCSLDEAIELLNPAAEALALAHRQGIAHRDVKPENLFLSHIDGESTTKVLDFGIAKVLASESAFTASPAATQDRPTAFTPRYGAPEQFDKRLGATGPWTDVFALGLILVELVIGERALSGDDPTQLYVSATNPRRRPTLRACGVPTSDAIEAVLAKALAIEPHDRYADASGFWQALQDAVASSPKVTAPVGLDSERALALEHAATVPSGAATASSAPTVTSLGEATAGPTAPAAGARPARDREDFEVGVIALASQGVDLTVANVVARLGVKPQTATTWLDALVAEGRLSRQHEPRRDLLLYSVRGLTVPQPASPRRLDRWQEMLLGLLQIDMSIEATVDPDKRKSVPLGVAAGLFLPGVGLVYAAPLFSTILVLVFGALGIGALGKVPFLGAVLSLVATGIFALASAALGGAYTWHYNRHGKRTPLRALRYRKR